MADTNLREPEISSNNSKNATQINSAVIHKTTSLPTPRNSIDLFPTTKVVSTPSTPTENTVLSKKVDSSEESIPQSKQVKPKPIYTHELPVNFFGSHSPPLPLSPLAFASKRNTPVSSPQIHPTIDTLVEPTETLDLHKTPKKDDVLPPSSLPDQYMLTKSKKFPKTHMLSLEDFDIKQTVGTGSFARVHVAKSKANGKYYAIKAINKKDLISRRQVEHVHNEREVLSVVSHPFLVKFWGTFQSETHVFFVMDYVPGGELFRLIKNKKLAEKDAKFYAAEVTLAIEYLHSINVAYRDLKPENILLDQRGHVKITDFGFAKQVEDVTWTVCGTPDYLAPEIIRSKGYTKAVDWWGLGVLIFELLAGHAPFSAKNPVDQYQKILECDITWPDHFSEEAKDLIQNLLQVKPSERFGNLKEGANDIKQHAWFKSLDFDRVLARDVTPPYVPNVKYEGDTGCFAYYEEMPLPYNLMHTSKAYCDHFPDF